MMTDPEIASLRNKKGKGPITYKRILAILYILNKQKRIGITQRKLRDLLENGPFPNLNYSDQDIKAAMTFLTKMDLIKCIHLTRPKRHNIITISSTGEAISNYIEHEIINESIIDQATDLNEFYTSNFEYISNKDNVWGIKEYRPELFRKIGPLWIDYESNYVAIRDKYVSAIENLLLNEKRNIMLIIGKRGSGKTAIIKTICYDLNKSANYQILYFNALEFSPTNIDKLKDAISKLNKYENTMCVFEDIHSNIKISMIIINYVFALQIQNKLKTKILFSSRYSIEEIEKLDNPLMDNLLDNSTVIISFLDAIIPMTRIFSKIMNVNFAHIEEMLADRIPILDYLDRYKVLKPDNTGLYYNFNILQPTSKLEFDLCLWALHLDSRFKFDILINNFKMRFVDPLLIRYKHPDALKMFMVLNSLWLHEVSCPVEFLYERYQIDKQFIEKLFEENEIIITTGNMIHLPCHPTFSSLFIMTCIQYGLVRTIPSSLRYNGGKMIAYPLNEYLNYLSNNKNSLVDELFSKLSFSMDDFSLDLLSNDFLAKRLAKFIEKHDMLDYLDYLHLIAQKNKQGMNNIDKLFIHLQKDIFADRISEIFCEDSSKTELDIARSLLDFRIEEYSVFPELGKFYNECMKRLPRVIYNHYISIKKSDIVKIKDQPIVLNWQIKLVKKFYPKAKIGKEIEICKDPSNNKVRYYPIYGLNKQ